MSKVTITAEAHAAIRSGLEPGEDFDSAPPNADGSYTIDMPEDLLVGIMLLVQFEGESMSDTIVRMFATTDKEIQ
jgi:hypothetical protein